MSEETIDLERDRYKTLGKEMKQLYKIGFSGGKTAWMGKEGI